eukprot:417246-Hanusia_phi.AAC.1
MRARLVSCWTARVAILLCMALGAQAVSVQVAQQPGRAVARLPMLDQPQVLVLDVGTDGLVTVKVEETSQVPLGGKPSYITSGGLVKFTDLAVRQSQNCTLRFWVEGTPAEAFSSTFFVAVMAQKPLASISQQFLANSWTAGQYLSPAPKAFLINSDNVTLVNARVPVFAWLLDEQRRVEKFHVEKSFRSCCQQSDCADLYPYRKTSVVSFAPSDVSFQFYFVVKFFLLLLQCSQLVRKHNEDRDEDKDKENTVMF